MITPLSYSCLIFYRTIRSRTSQSQTRNLFFSFSATDLAQHLRIKNELSTMINQGYDTSNERHHELLLSLLMTASDLADQSKDWITSRNTAVSFLFRHFVQFLGGYAVLRFNFAIRPCWHYRPILPFFGVFY